MNLTRRQFLTKLCQLAGVVGLAKMTNNTLTDNDPFTVPVLPKYILPDTLATVDDFYKFYPGYSETKSHLNNHTNDGIDEIVIANDDGHIDSVPVYVHLDTETGRYHIR